MTSYGHSVLPLSGSPSSGSDGPFKPASSCLPHFLPFSIIHSLPHMPSPCESLRMYGLAEDINYPHGLWSVRSMRCGQSGPVNLRPQIMSRLCPQPFSGPQCPHSKRQWPEKRLILNFVLVCPPTSLTLSVPQTHRVHSFPWAFALALPTAWITLPSAWLPASDSTQRLP